MEGIASNDAWEVRPSIPLQAQGISMTKNSTISVAVLGHVPNVRGREMMPIIGASYLVKLTSPPIHGFRFVLSMPIFVNAARERMSQELPLFTMTLLTSIPPRFTVRTIASECG